MGTLGAVGVCLTILLISNVVSAQEVDDGSSGGSLSLEEGLLIFCIVATTLLIITGLYVLITSIRSRSKKHAVEGVNSGTSGFSGILGLGSSPKKKKDSEILYALPSVGTTENSVSDSPSSLK